MVATATSCLLFVIGCADEEVVTPSTLPVVQSLSEGSYAIGEVFSMQGRNFLPENDGANYILFRGIFTPADGGAAEEVEVEAPVFMVNQEDDGAQTVQWNRFGPYAHPFLADGKLGRFQGTIRAITEHKDGTVVLGDTSTMEFDVDPSLEFVEVQPEGADCGIPALSGFGGLPYRITVKAMGFVPTKYEFQVTSLQEHADLRTPSVFTKVAQGPTSTIGIDEDIVFQTVPSDLKYYIAAIVVRATDAASGKEVEAMLPFDIHRPIELQYDGNFQVAEYYQPEPVTACIPGSIGNRASYSESTTKSVQRSVAVRISKNFNISNGVSNTQNWQEGYQEGEAVASSVLESQTTSRSEGTALQRGQSHNESESNNFSQGTTDAENWNTSHNVGGSLSMTVGAEGGASIPLVAEGKVKTSTTATGSYGYNTGQGGSQARSRNWGASSNRGSSNSMSESYTLNNSTSNSRSISDTTSRNSSRTYSFGAAATVDQRISEGMTEDESQTWSESSANTTLTSYSGFIPVGKFGVFYRQTIRMMRVAKMVSYNACGVQEDMGEILLNEWKWAPDLAIGDTCDAELPPANLPPSQCIIPPCE
jgi:hypothetical protein